MNTTLTAIPGIRVGHWSDAEAKTGCTVVLCPQGMTASCDVRGSAPGTRETDLLQPTGMVDQVHAICLAGGSAFGLAAADGVMHWLAEHEHGLDVGLARIPLVPAAILFDLGVGRPDVYPTAEAGYAACVAASDEPVALGQVGAGTGCTVGKSLGFNQASPGGLGSALKTMPDGLQVAALAAVNAVGNVIDPASGRIVAGMRHPQTNAFVSWLALQEGQIGQTIANMAHDPSQNPRANTTLVVVATNAALTKTECKKVAEMAHDGLARCINPVHMTIDGDTVFVLAGGAHPANVNLVGALAAEAVTAAVLTGIA
jgi:L-aminopeptidase/D-esterase-like protein